MRSLLVGGRRRDQFSGMGLEDLAGQVPDSARESVMDWGFASKPLRLPEIDPVRTRLTKPDVGEIVRFCGVFTHVDEEYGVMRPFGEGIGASAAEMRFNVPLGRHVGRVSLLRGLIMDVGMRIEHKPEDGLDREASLVAVHGIEQQVRQGDVEGLLRGQIVDVARGESSGLWHADLASADGNAFRVHANPSDENGAFQQGNVVALRVMNIGDEHTYRLNRQPGPALPHTIMLQEAVALPAA